MAEQFALIVEDDRDTANIFSLALQGVNFRTETIRDGTLALSRLSEIVPDVVVLDLHLPGVSGKDILEEIRKRDPLSKTKVILVTADAARGDELREDSDLVLLKPVSPLQLRTLASRLTS